MEIKALIEGLKTDFEEFKRANNSALAQKAEKGSIDSLLDEKINRINAAISEKSDKLHTRLAELERRLQVEEAMGGLGKPDEVRREVAAFAALLAAEGSTQSVRARAADLVSPEFLGVYKSGLNKMLRHGPAAQLSAQEKAAMEVGSDPNGGYLVYPDLTGRMAKLQYETTPMRQLASIQEISSDRLDGGDDLDQADAGWVAEKGARIDTATPLIGKWEIVAQEIYAQPKATQKLLDDASVDFEAWLAEKGSDRFSRLENNAFVIGNGKGKPRGFVTYPAGVPTASAWQKIEQIPSGASGAFAASKPGDALINMTGALKAPYLPNAKWLMGRLVVAEVRKLADTQGRYLWQPDFGIAPGGTLLGFPVVRGEDLAPLAANSLSIAFGDFKEGYQIVDRIGIRVLRDPFTDKPNVRFYMTKRVGGDVVNFEALKLMKFAVS